MTWTERVGETLAPLGIEQHDVLKMLREWYYTGNAYDLEAPIDDCELCSHPEIRYQFEIVNQYTANELLVGSECIKRFRISALDESGKRLGQYASHQKVNRDRNKLISNARQKRTINTLVELSMIDEDFDITSFIDYYRDREAFTPKQLNLLIWRLTEHSIEFKKADFRLIIRRNREKDQLRQMPDWQIKQIWECMSSAQRDWYRQNISVPD